MNNAQVKTNVNKWFLYFIFGTVLFFLAFNLFYNLNKVPIHDWDEARHGVNAYEMLKSNNFIVNTYGYRNDYWNLKPPFSFWMVMMGYKLFGFTPFGLRFFSALSAFLTIITIFAFMLYKHGKKAALISSAVLMTIGPYILSHAARSGDADSFLILFFTIAMIGMILMEKNIRWFYLAGLALSLSFLTKSWHALAIIATGGFYLLFSGQLIKIKIKQWLIFLLCLFTPILIWFELRYSNDGLEFFKNMISFDLLNRTSRPLEGHIGGYDFYLKRLLKWNVPWVLLSMICIPSLVKIYRSENRKFDRRYFLAILLWLLVPFLLFSIARTKLDWYVYCIFPAIAIGIGIICNKVIWNTQVSRALKVFMVIFLALGLCYNEFVIIKKVSNPIPDTIQETLKKACSLNRYKGSNIYTLCGEHYGPLSWDQRHFLAAELYNDFRPINGGLKSFLKDKTRYKLLVAFKDSRTKEFERQYNLKVILENKNIVLIGR